MENKIDMNNIGNIKLFLEKYRENLLKEFYEQTIEFMEPDGTVRYIKFNPGSETIFSGWMVQDYKWSEMKKMIKELEKERMYEHQYRCPECKKNSTEEQWNTIGKEHYGENYVPLNNQFNNDCYYICPCCGYEVDECRIQKI